jgi:hypothetical protein
MKDEVVGAGDHGPSMVERHLDWTFLMRRLHPRALPPWVWYAGGVSRRFAMVGSQQSAKSLNSDDLTLMALML